MRFLKVHKSYCNTYSQFRKFWYMKMFMQTLNRSAKTNLFHCEKCGLV